jgi:hypothetical protein
MQLEPHYVIDLTDGTRLHVDTTAGPLSGVDVEDDPADGAAALWRAIEAHDPIYVNGATGPSMPRNPIPRVWYPNLAHVVAIFEIGDLTK